MVALLRVVCVRARGTAVSGSSWSETAVVLGQRQRKFLVRDSGSSWPEGRGEKGVGGERGRVREWEEEGEREIEREKPQRERNNTHTHTHTHRERERERERGTGARTRMRATSAAVTPPT